ncbi:SurA N-terminal domain-containing protein [Halobacteriovorax sp.]|uniref:SurA N-terminal domain-containing protein n=1 Tax=Halobacteriovorax sp. TaxID=2020862 RepID=UPI003568EF78
MKQLIISFIFLTFSQTHAKLLDKTIAVFNDNVITLSQIKRVKDNISSRKNISPLIYKKSTYTDQEILDIMIERLLIREKLGEIGYIRNDEQVESEITNIEKRLGLSRTQLLSFLKSNNMSFDEYFEIIRETIEFNIFNGRIIRPLISVTDQEVKNFFYKTSKDKTLAFKYTIVDFSLEESRMKKGMLSKFPETLEKFQVNGVLPKDYEDVQTNVLGDITEDGLTNNLKQLLKATDEGKFTKPIKLGDTFHVFFVKKKDLVESQIYLNAKNQIRGKLMGEQAGEVTDLWFKRELSKHYIKTFITK